MHARGNKNIYLKILFQGRLKPGRMLLVDTKEKIFKKDEILKKDIANLRPVSSWLKEVKFISITFVFVIFWDQPE